MAGVPKPILCFLIVFTQVHCIVALCLQIGSHLTMHRTNGLSDYRTNGLSEWAIKLSNYRTNGLTDYQNGLSSSVTIRLTDYRTNGCWCCVQRESGPHAVESLYIFEHWV